MNAGTVELTEEHKELLCEFKADLPFFDKTDIAMVRGWLLGRKKGEKEK